MSKPNRIFVKERLGPGAEVRLADETAHYVRDVMRLKEGAEILMFNGKDGEWLCMAEAVSKREFVVRATKQTRAQSAEKLAQTELIFSPLRHAHQDMLIQKATELGVSSLTPALMNHSAVKDFNAERADAIAREAAEQSERLSMPEISALMPLEKLIKNFDFSKRTLVYLDERQNAGARNPEEFRHLGASDMALLVGPEGGFSAAEFALLAGTKAIPITLGRLILRAETAAIAALSLWNLR